jgi:hypothetical protein
MLKTEAGAQRMVGYVFSSIDIKKSNQYWNNFKSV